MDISGISSFFGSISSALSSNLFVILFNFSLLFSIAAAFGLLTKLYHDKAVVDEMYNRNQRKKQAKSSNGIPNFLQDGFFGNLFKNIEAYLSIKGKEKSALMMTYVTISVSIILGILMFSTGQKLFGVLLPFIICLIVSYVLSLIKVNRIDKIKEALPNTINNLSRVMTKYSSLKTILYETASTVPDPMQSILKQLSLRMSSESGIDVLNDFMDEYNDIWIYSFAFTLVSYLEDSPKNDVVNNLKELRDIITKELDRKKAEAIEKKMTVAINYVLCGIAALGEIANIMFNPGGQAFFFKSVGGFAAFLIGNGLLIVCVISNILLTKK